MALVYPVIFGGSPSGWQRPSTWLARPAISSGEKTVKMLVAVYPDTTNYIKLVASDNLTINWGDGNTIDYSSPDVEYNLDYSGITTYLVGAVKQCWINVTAQAGQSISRFILNYDKTTTLLGISANQNILEILLGKVDISGTYNFYLAKMRSLKSIIFQETFSTNNNIYRTFAANFNLENIVGSFPSNNYNSGVFDNCYRLIDFSKLDYSCNSPVTAQGAFSNVGAITLDLPNFNFNSGHSLISNCRNLLSASLHLTNILNAYQMALNSYLLENITILSGSASQCKNFYQAFSSCNFKETPSFNLTSSSDNKNMFDGNYLLIKSNLSNIKASIGFRYCSLSHAEILNIFTNQLQTVVTTQIIDLRNNPDIANLPAATIAVATAKNWTVQIA